MRPPSANAEAYMSRRCDAQPGYGVLPPPAVPRHSVHATVILRVSRTEGARRVDIVRGSTKPVARGQGGKPKTRPFATARKRANSGFASTPRCCGGRGILRPTASTCAHRGQGASLRSAPATRGSRSLRRLRARPPRLAPIGRCPTLTPYRLWPTTCPDSVVPKRPLTQGWRISARRWTTAAPGT